MQRILATIAIIAMAACGSAAQQTGPKTTNPPLTKEQKVKDGGQKPPVEIDGLTVKVNALDFQMTMTAEPWSGKTDPQDNGGLRLVFLRKDIHAVMLIIPVKAEGESAKSIAESQVKAAGADGQTPGALTDEGHGRFAFTADSAASDPDPSRNYLGVVPHPTIKDAYLVVVASSAPKDSDAFLKSVRSIADSIAPIQ